MVYSGAKQKRLKLQLSTQSGECSSRDNGKLSQSKGRGAKAKKAASGKCARYLTQKLLKRSYVKKIKRLNVNNRYKRSECYKSTKCLTQTTKKIHIKEE